MVYKKILSLRQRLKRFSEFQHIISACNCPLLNIGPIDFQRDRSEATRNLDEVVGPSGRWPSHAALSHITWSPIQYFFTSSAVHSSHYAACPLPLQLDNPLGYVDDLCFSTNFLVSDSITQRNPEHSPLHNPLSDFELFRKACCKRPRFPSVSHHW